MRKIQTIIVIAGLLFALAASAAETPKGMKKIEPLPSDLEIQLALSALPRTPQRRCNGICFKL